MARTLRSMPAVLVFFVAACGGGAARTTDAGTDTATDVVADVVPTDQGGSEAAEPDPGQPDAVAGDTGTETASDVPPADLPPPPKLLKGPYLQQVTDTGVRVLIEVPEPPAAGGTVWVGPPGGAEGNDKSFAMTFAQISVLDLPAPGTFLGEAVLTGLLPDTEYHYCVSVGGDPACARFFTAPAALSTTPFSFVAYGDTRTDRKAHQAVVDAIVATAEQPRFALQTGDLEEVGASLDSIQVFFDVEEELLGSMPFYPMPGNHDAVLNGLEYYAAFYDLPQPLGDKFNYSFTYGNVAFVTLDTEDDVTTGPVFDWLGSELKTLHDEGYQLFVAFHHPIYTFSNHAEYPGGIAKLAPLFESNGVVAVFAGHNHCYEHFLVNGVHYFTLGGGGAPLYGVDSGVIPAQKAFEVKAVSVHHHAIVDVAGAKIVLTAIDDDAGGTVIETVTLRP